MPKQDLNPEPLVEIDNDGNVVPIQPKGALAKLLEAANKDCIDQYAWRADRWHIANCPSCGAKADLAVLALALARELIEKRSAGQALAEALEFSCAMVHEIRKDRQDTDHGGTVDECEADSCVACRTRLVRWAELTETEVRDGTA